MVQAIRAAQPARRLAIRAPNWTVDGWRRGPLIRGALPVRFSVAARNAVAPQIGCVPTQREVPPCQTLGNSLGAPNPPLGHIGRHIGVGQRLRPCRRGRDDGARPCDDRSVADEAGRVDISQTSSGADRTSTIIVRDATGDDHVASVGGLATIGGLGVRWPRFRCRDRARGPLRHHGDKLPFAPTAPTTKPRLVMRRWR